MSVPVNPFSAWSLLALFGWLFVVVVVWLLFFAYGRARSRKGGAKYE